jgi:hypothetical protein
MRGGGGEAFHPDWNIEDANTYTVQRKKGLAPSSANRSLADDGHKLSDFKKVPRFGNNFRGACVRHRADEKAPRI